MHILFFLAYITMMLILIGGCGHFYEGLVARPAFKEANDFLNQGNYKDSLGKYEQIINRYPAVGDRVLFEMGVIYASPRNPQKDYQKSLECFQNLIKSYPASEYKQDGEVMISLINEVIKKTSIIDEVTKKASFTGEVSRKPLSNDVTGKDKKIVLQRKQIETLEQQVKELEKKIEQMKEVDMNLKEKKKSFFEKQ